MSQNLLKMSSKEMVAFDFVGKSGRTIFPMLGREFDDTCSWDVHQKSGYVRAKIMVDGFLRMTIDIPNRILESAVRNTRSVVPYTDRDSILKKYAKIRKIE